MKQGIYDSKGNRIGSMTIPDGEPPVRSSEIVGPAPDCCAEWSRSGKAIDALLIPAWTHGAKYEGVTFSFCPWCGRARPNDKVSEPPHP